MGHTQLALFPTTLRSEFLIAPDSAKKAFYNLWLEVKDGVYQVRKESGSKEKVLDRRIWTFTSYEKAEKNYERRIKDKLNPERPSPRKYQRKVD